MYLKIKGIFIIHIILITEIYYIAYYLLLIDMISADTANSIYIDKKDTRGGQKVKELKNNLLTTKYSKKTKWKTDVEFKSSLINKIQIIGL